MSDTPWWLRILKWVLSLFGAGMVAKAEAKKRQKDDEIDSKPMGPEDADAVARRLARRGMSGCKD